MNRGLSQSLRRTMFALGWAGFAPVDQSLKCDCGRPAVHFRAWGRCCSRCKAIEDRMEEFHHHNRDNYEPTTD